MKIVRYCLLVFLLLFSFHSTSFAIALMPEEPIKLLTYSDKNTDYYIIGNSINTAVDDINSYLSVILIKEDKNNKGVVFEFLTYKFENNLDHFYFRFDSIFTSINGEEPKEIKTSFFRTSFYG